MDSSSAASSAEFSGSQSWLQSRRGVRVVGKIRPFLSSEILGASDGESSCSTCRAQISLTRCDGDYASIAFGDQTTGFGTFLLFLEFFSNSFDVNFFDLILYFLCYVGFEKRNLSFFYHIGESD